MRGKYGVMTGTESGKNIVIAISIAPRNISGQRTALSTWINRGFRIVSLNVPEEIAALASHFTEVSFVPVDRCISPVPGKNYVYLDDMVSYLHRNGSSVCGIINSDIHLAAGPDFVDFILKHAHNSLVFGSRVDISSLDGREGEYFDRGFDFFFFDRELLDCYVSNDFCIGMPWWDIWFSLWPLFYGRTIKLLESPVALHVKHNTNYNEQQWLDYGDRFMRRIISEVSQMTETFPLSCADILRCIKMDIAHMAIFSMNRLREYAQTVAYACPADACSSPPAVHTEMDMAVTPQFDNHYAQAGKLFEGVAIAAENRMKYDFLRYILSLQVCYFNIKGLSCYADGNKAVSLKCFEDALAINPFDRITVLNCGGALIGERKYEHARMLFEHYLDRFEDDREVRGEWKKLKVLHEKVADLNRLGVDILAEGDSEEAKRAFEIAAEICPDFAATYDNIGKFCLGKGDAGNAVKQSSPMCIPIVFIHKGNSFYLESSLRQARASNPNSTVYLIGDSTNGHYDFVEHVPMGVYLRGTEEFSQVYRHLSGNPYDFELMCFLRWFILRDFMEERALSQCVYADSDVLIFCDVSEEQKKYSQFDFTVWGGGVPVFTFINNPLALKHYCNFAVHLYTDAEELKVLEDFYVKFLHKEREAGVSDMTAFSLFVSRRMGRIGQMAVPVGDSTYDMDISISGGFEMYNGTKKIYWINDRPYGKLVDSKRLVLFNIIHFPGGGVKWLMNLYGCENLGKYITDPAYLFEVGIVEGDLEYKVLAVDRFERMVMLHSAVVLVGRKEYGCLKRIFEGYLYKKPHDDEVAAWLREVNRVLGNTETLNLEGEKRFLKGDAGGAMQAFSGAAELSSDYVPAYSNLGVACYSLGKIDAAVRYFERAITIDPLHRDTVLNFGNVLIQLQRYEGARKIIEMYLCHEQNDGEARQLLEEVEQRTFRHSVCGEA